MSNLWQEEKDPITGRSSLTENIIPRVVQTYCKKDEHYFELAPDRTVVCKKCGMGSKYIPGLHKLADGKLIKLK